MRMVISVGAEDWTRSASVFESMQRRRGLAGSAASNLCAGGACHSALGPESAPSGGPVHGQPDRSGPYVVARDVVLPTGKPGQPMSGAGAHRGARSDTNFVFARPFLLWAWVGAGFLLSIQHPPTCSATHRPFLAAQCVQNSHVLLTDGEGSHEGEDDERGGLHLCDGGGEAVVTGDRYFNEEERERGTAKGMLSAVIAE